MTALALEPWIFGLSPTRSASRPAMTHRYRPGVALAEQTDDELMAEVAAGARREAAFRELVRRHGAAMTGVVRAVLRDRDRADDVVQEALLRVYESRERWVPGKGSLRGWLLRIARNLALNAQRDGARRATASLAPAADDSDEGRGLPADPRAARPDAPLERDEEVRALRAALDGLQAPDREVLELRYQQGLGFDEVGAVVGASGAAVKQRAWRALGRLRALLGGEPDAPARGRGRGPATGRGDR